MRKWRDLTPDEKAARERRTRKGGAAAVVAGLCLIVVGIGATGLAVHAAGRISCPPDSAHRPSDTSVVYTTQSELYLNGTLCLAVKSGKYFAAERADVDAAQLAVKEARKAVVQAGREPDPAKVQRSLEVAQKDLEVAQKQLQAAQATFRTRPAIKTVNVFIDDMRTPLTLELHVSETPPDQDGWAWKPVKVVPPEDADSDDGKIWRQILAGTPFPGVRSFKLGIGDTDGKLPRPHAVSDKQVHLRVYHPWPLVSGAVGLLLSAAGLFARGWYTPLLRDRTAGDVKDAPFSLARTQFAWWFFLALGGFLFIWLVTGQFIGVVTSGVLTLLGISGVSGLAAQAIDTQTPATDAVSQGFLKDILSGDGGVSLHRVQMAAWTLVLGLIFLWSAFWTFSFPRFDANLLVLAGIVNGVYLGFKFPTK